MNEENNMVSNNKIIHPELSYLTYGLCFKTHNELGRYRNELTYADFLEQLFKEHNIQYVREQPIPKTFSNEYTRRNVPDFVVGDVLVVDLKAKRVIEKEDYFQMKRYLAASGKKLGIIVNFREKRLSPKRILNSSI